MQESIPIHNPHYKVNRPQRFFGSVDLPGDKSISHRALIFNAIANGNARISNLAPGADVNSSIKVLQALGVSIETLDAKGTYFVRGKGNRGLSESSKVLNAGNSGTTLRLLSGVLSHHSFFSVLSGDASLRSRPVYRVIDPLRLMGATLMARNGDRQPPIAIKGSALRGIEYTLPVASAQVKTAIMLASLVSDAPSTLHQPAISRNHTELMFRAMGAHVEEQDNSIRTHPANLQAIDVVVPGDVSSAAFWLVAAVCHPNAEVQVLNVGVNPTRTGVLEVLEAMGADIALSNHRVSGGEPVADIVARSSKLKAVKIDGDLIVRAIDEIPILAVAACFAEGTTVIEDAQELRVKETDRIKAIVQELTRLGASVEEAERGFSIKGGRSLVGATVESHGDHRMAMALAIAGSLSEGTTIILNTEAADVSYPAFWETFDDLCGKEETI